MTKKTLEIRNAYLEGQNKNLGEANRGLAKSLSELRDSALNTAVGRLTRELQGKIDELATTTEECRHFRQEAHFAQQRLEQEMQEHLICRRQIDQAYRSESGSLVVEGSRKRIVELTTELMEQRRETNRVMELARNIGHLALIVPAVVPVGLSPDNVNGTRLSR